MCARGAYSIVYTSRAELFCPVRAAATTTAARAHACACCWIEAFCASCCTRPERPASARGGEERNIEVFPADGFRRERHAARGIFYLPRNVLATIRLAADAAADAAAKDFELEVYI